MNLRQATDADADRCWQIVAGARRRMAEADRDQWRGEYPARADVERDIEQGIGYVLCRDDVPLAYGAVVTTGEPAYDSIDGVWLSAGEPFVVLHRLSVADEVLGTGLARQYFKAVEDFARKRDIGWFRVDTNYDNAEMLHLLPAIGFTLCGEISFQGGIRKAFEKRI